MIKISNNGRFKRVRGNSILEILVALSLISVTCFVAVQIYINVQKSSLPFLKMKAIEMAMDLSEHRSGFDESVKNGQESGLTIVKEINSIEEFPDMRVLHIIVRNTNDKRKIIEIRRIIENDEKYLR